MRCSYPEKEIRERIYDFFSDLAAEFGMKIKMGLHPTCEGCDDYGKDGRDECESVCPTCPFYEKQNSLLLKNTWQTIVVDDAILKGIKND